MGTVTEDYGRLSDVLTGKCAIERRYVLRGLFMHSLFVCLSNKVGVWCVLLSIAVLLFMC